MQQQQQTLATHKRQHQQVIAQQLISSYRLGQQSQLKLLLKQQDSRLLSRHIKYFDYLSKARASQIAKANSTLAQLATITPQIEQERLQLQRTAKNLRQQQRALRSEQAQREQTLKDLEAAISSKDQQLKASEQDRQRLQQLIARVVRVAGDIEAPVNSQAITQLKGQLPWPAQGKIAHHFNSQRVADKVRWQGLLIAAASDSPVTAIHHGQVVFADYLRGHGLLIIVDHGLGILSLYAHNKTLLKTLGEWVNTGEQIASVGASGGLPKAGLYFEMRHNGNPTNPHHWLKKRG